jgi:chemotaxis protein CheX
MQLDLFFPFEQALHHTFDMMLGCPVQSRGEVQCEQAPEFYEITGVMAMSGKAEGSMVLSMCRSMAQHAAATLLMAEPADLSDDDICDAVGELTNMVAGAAKAKLEAYAMHIGLPNVVCGPGHTVKFPHSVLPLCLPLESAWGRASLTVGLVVTEAHQLVGV